MRTVTYGLGGYDPSKPNDNIVEIINTPDFIPSIEGLEGFYTDDEMREILATPEWQSQETLSWNKIAEPIAE